MIRKIFIAVVILLALLSGVLGYLYYFWYPELPRVQEAMGTEPPTFTLDLEPINVPVIRNGSVERYIVFRVVILFDQELHKDRAAERTTSLRDRFFQSLYQYTETITNEQNINKTMLQLRLGRDASELLGELNFNRVVISGAFERK